MAKKKIDQKPYLTLPNHNHTKICLDPLPVPIMITIASIFFLFLAYLFVTLPSNTPSARAYASLLLSKN